MRQGWGVTYFKLDANFWGAMHGGRFHDPKATRIDAYRRGLTTDRAIVACFGVDKADFESGYADQPDDVAAAIGLPVNRVSTRSL